MLSVGWRLIVLVVLVLVCVRRLRFVACFASVVVSCVLVVVWCVCCLLCVRSLLLLFVAW